MAMSKPGAERALTQHRRRGLAPALTATLALHAAAALVLAVHPSAWRWVLAAVIVSPSAGFTVMSSSPSLVRAKRRPLRVVSVRSGRQRNPMPPAVATSQRSTARR